MTPVVAIADVLAIYQLRLVLRCLDFSVRPKRIIFESSSQLERIVDWCYWRWVWGFVFGYNDDKNSHPKYNTWRCTRRLSLSLLVGIYNLKFVNRISRSTIFENLTSSLAHPTNKTPSHHLLVSLALSTMLDAFSLHYEMFTGQR